jgi:hypothetical protein
MTSTEASTLHERCAENIAMLELLGRVPILPTSHPHVEPAGGVSGHVLPLRTERDLVSTLAALSSTSDNPHHITAVCVHEQGTRLDVLVAVNAASSTASAYLKSVGEGFEKIFGLLRTATTGK